MSHFHRCDEEIRLRLQEGDVVFVRIRDLSRKAGKRGDTMVSWRPELLLKFLRCMSEKDQRSEGGLLMR